MIFSLFALHNSSWAQSDTLPNNLGKKVSTPEGLKKVIDSKDTRFVIVDVRRKISYDIGHIPTAINIPYGIIANVKNPPPKDKYLILYCNHGLVTKAAGERFFSGGYKFIFDWGGITAWEYGLEK